MTDANLDSGLEDKMQGIMPIHPDDFFKGFLAYTPGPFLIADPKEIFSAVLDLKHDKKYSVLLSRIEFDTTLDYPGSSKLEISLQDYGHVKYIELSNPRIRSEPMRMPGYYFTEFYLNSLKLTKIRTEIESDYNKETAALLNSCIKEFYEKTKSHDEIMNGLREVYTAEHKLEKTIRRIVQGKE